MPKEGEYTICLFQTKQLEARYIYDSTYKEADKQKIFKRKKQSSFIWKKGRKVTDNFYHLTLEITRTKEQFRLFKFIFGSENNTKEMKIHINKALILLLGVVVFYEVSAGLIWALWHNLTWQCSNRENSMLFTAKKIPRTSNGTFKNAWTKRAHTP